MNRLLSLTALLCIVFATANSTPLDESAIISTAAAFIDKNGFGSQSRPSLSKYNQMRSKFTTTEESRALGASIVLSKKEAKTNAVIMAAKNKEVEEGISVPHLFNPSQYFFNVLDKIKNSELFSLLKSMPKGAVLHAHDTALCSVDFLIKLTYRDNLYVCSDESGDAKQLIFSESMPSTVVSDCSWELMSVVREAIGAEEYDAYLQNRFSLYQSAPLEDNNAIWVKFGGIFRLVDGLLTYAPVWGDYFYQALEEFYADGVQYLEFRTTLPVLYDLVGTSYTNLDTARIYQNKLSAFKALHPDFIGAKLIYAPVRAVESTTVAEYVKTAIELKAQFPTFFAGFDLVGQEELGKPLIDFMPELLSVPVDINFFFHSGETNWYGSTTDENLIDAVLLGTKRIGHGFALNKHPEVLANIIKNGIAVEVNPVSNQVLQLTSDLRNHPCAQLFAEGYPVVISSDDPSFWRATPLTHDFYAAFLGIASAKADLKLLKQLAINSIEYSAMSTAEKRIAFAKWQSRWDKYVASLGN